MGNLEQKNSQPFSYPLKKAFVEPDWRRLPGFKDATVAEWESALWQRQRSIKNLKELKNALGAYLTDDLALEIERDQKEYATMSMLIPPQMLNTILSTETPPSRLRGSCFTRLKF